jgi:GR25 family glycosyltransferase involved in LPS biosynthesis
MKQIVFVIKNTHTNKIVNILESVYDIELIDEVKDKGHIRAIELATERKLKYAIVIDGDCLLVQDFVKRFEIILEYLNSNDNWNIYLGGANKVNEKNITEQIHYNNEILFKLKNANMNYLAIYNEKIYDLYITMHDSVPIDKIWVGYVDALISIPFLAYYNNKDNINYERILKNNEKILQSYINKKKSIFIIQNTNKDIIKNNTKYNIIKIPNETNKDIDINKQTFLTHVKCLKIAKKYDMKNIIILYNDIKLVDDFNERIDLIESYLNNNNDWDIYVGGGNKFLMNNIITKIGNNEALVNINKGNGLYFVCYNNNCYDFLINYEDKTIPLDTIWYKENKKVITSIPFIAYKKDRKNIILKNIKDTETKLYEEINLLNKINIYLIRNENKENVDILQNKLKQYNINIIDCEDKYIGHLEAINKAKEKNEEIILVIEDIAELVNNFNERLLNIYKFLNENEEWKIYLGGCSRVNEKNIVNKYVSKENMYIELKSAKCTHFVFYKKDVFDILLNSSKHNDIESLWQENKINIFTSYPFISFQKSKLNENPNILIKKSENILQEYINNYKSMKFYLIDSGNSNCEKIFKILKNYDLTVIPKEKDNENENINRFLSHKKCLDLALKDGLKKIYVIEDSCNFEENIIERIKIINNYLEINDNWYIYMGLCNKTIEKNILNRISLGKEKMVEINKGSCFNFVCYNKSVYEFFINNTMENPIDRCWNNQYNALVSVPFLCHQNEISNNSIINTEKILKEYINKVIDIDFYVINLKESVQRMNLIYNKFSDFNIIRIDAIKQTEGWKGCFMSHLKCIEYAKKNKLKNIWVLEDDCLPAENFKDRIITIKEYLDNNNDWYIYLGGCNRLNNDNFLSKTNYKDENFIKINFSYCMHMVCYNEKIYDYLLNHPINIEIDKAWQKFTNAIVSVPFLAYQLSSYSYIQKKYVEYYRFIKATNQKCLEYLKEHTGIDVYLIVKDFNSDIVKKLCESLYGLNINLIKSSNEKDQMKNTLLSHIKCLKIAKKNNLKNIIVIEEQIIVSENINEYLMKIKNYIDTNDNWNILLGGCKNVNDNNIINVVENNDLNLIRLKNKFVSYFICYNNNIYNNIINSNLDTSLEDICSNFENIIVPIPFVANRYISDKRNEIDIKILNTEKKLIEYKENNLTQAILVN